MLFLTTLCQAEPGLKKSHQAEPGAYNDLQYSYNISKRQAPPGAIDNRKAAPCSKKT